MSDPLSSSEIRERATQKQRDIRVMRYGDRWLRLQMEEIDQLLTDLLALLASRETPRQDEDELAHVDTLNGSDVRATGEKNELAPSRRRGRGKNPPQPRVAVFCRCGAQWFGNAAVDNPVIDSHIARCGPSVSWADFEKLWWHRAKWPKWFPFAGLPSAGERTAVDSASTSPERKAEEKKWDCANGCKSYNYACVSCSLIRQAADLGRETPQEPRQP